MKRWRWGVAAIAVVVAGVAVAVTLNGRDGDDDAATMAAVPWPAPSVAPAPQPGTSPADGELRVVEQGFTQRDETVELTLTPGYGPGRPEPYKPVYAAFTLQNTSTKDIAYEPKVKITYFDTADKAVTKDDNWTYTGPVLPGTSATYAGFLNIDSVRVKRITVELTGAKWLAAADVRARTAALTARDVKLLPTTIPGLTTVTYTASNGLDKPVTAAGLVIFRNAAGKLLGAQGTDDIGRAELSLPPGDSTASATYQTWFPPGTDKGRLEVTLRPGYLSPDPT